MAKKENIKQDNKKSKKEEKNKRHFFKDFKAELKRVVWPTPKQLVNNTIAVVTIVLVIGVIVFALDMGFELLNKQNAKLQNNLQEKYSNSIESDTTSDEENSTETEENESDDASSEESNTEIEEEDAEE